MLIAQISDLHLRPKGELAYGVAETNGLTERAIHALLRLDPAPDAVLVTGDIADCGLPEEYALAVELFARLPMPVFLLPGNHDRRDTMRQAFPAYPCWPRHGPLHHAVTLGNALRLILLDTVVVGASEGALDADGIAFLDAALEQAPDLPTIVALHHPPIVCGIGHMDQIRLLEGADRLTEALSRHPQVERVVAGHHHRAITTRFAGTICQIAPSVAHQVCLDLAPGAASAFVLEPPAYLLHSLGPGTGLVTHFAYVDRAPGPFPFVLPAEYPGHSNGLDPVRDEAAILPAR